MKAASCHAPHAGTLRPGEPVVALVGAPNVGKSTLFNAVTGARVQTGNWPGTTVDVARGQWQGWNVIDLPGAYSLDAASSDEQLTRDLLDDPTPPDVVVIVVDSAHLARSLYMVAQIRERALPVVLALTMGDVARARGMSLDADALAAAAGCPVATVDPRHASGLEDLRAAVEAQLDAACCVTARPLVDAVDPTDTLAVEDERFTWLEGVRAAALTQSDDEPVSMSDKIDRIVTAPILGPLIFLGVMWLVFQLTTTVASPMQDFLEGIFSGPVSGAVRWLVGSAGLGGTWVEGLLVDGLVAGVGMVLTFVPLMAIMFVLLALLEDSGYMARAAVVTDSLMRRLGLPGRAFLPLVVGFGCNVPAISATRVLPSARQRILTALLVPFTACTARLTVYVLVATTFFGRWAGTVVFAMYVLSIVLVVAVGWCLRKTLWRTMGSDPLVLDLPPYQRPTLRLTASVTWQRLKGFLKTAGGIIVVTVMLVWAAQSMPARGGGSFGDVPVEDSAYAVAAQAVTPVFEPTGFASWETTSALVVGFVAKEAVLSSWAQTYAVADPAEGDEAPLEEKISESFAHSSGGHPVPAVLAFLVFLTAYTPCVATLAAQRREIGLRWTLFGVACQLATAYLGAVLVFQVGRWFW